MVLLCIINASIEFILLRRLNDMMIKTPFYHFYSSFGFIVSFVILLVLVHFYVMWDLSGWTEKVMYYMFWP